MNINDWELAKMLEQAYKDQKTRNSTMFYNKEILFMDKKESNWLWVIYEGERQLVVATHGFDQKTRSNFTKLLSDVFFDNNENNKLVERFKKLFASLRFNKKDIILTGHSLGAWLIAKAEVEVGFANYHGVLFSPYSLGNPKIKEFIQTNPRYKIIFYENDPFFLTFKGKLTNSVIFTPRTNPFTFLNGHTLKNFIRPINQINLDLKSKNVVKEPEKQEEQKPEEEKQPEEEKKPEQKEEEIIQKQTSLKILSYNIKMFDRLLSDLRNNFRTKEIAKRILQLQPDVIVFQELFDNESTRLFKRLLAGYNHSKKVGDNPDFFGGKLINGGVILFSKFPIINQETKIYKHSSKDDKLSSKGAVRIKIEKDGIPIHIIGQHSQAGKRAEEFKIKETQFDDLSGLIKDQEPTIIVGDFNINSRKFGQFFDTQTEKHNLIRVSPTEDTSNGDFSNDGSGNILDHLLYNKTEFEIKVSTSVLKDEFNVQGGYKVREKGFFRFKKHKLSKIIKKLSKKRKKKKFHQLSDHFAIMFNVNISTKQ